MASLMMTALQNIQYIKTPFQDELRLQYIILLHYSIFQIKHQINVGGYEQAEDAIFRCILFQMVLKENHESM